MRKKLMIVIGVMVLTYLIWITLVPEWMIVGFR
jgi:hypothetical protein